MKPMTVTKILPISDIPEKRHLNYKISFRKLLNFFFFRNSVYFFQYVFPMTDCGLS